MAVSIEKPILLTGASGNLGRMLARAGPPGLAAATDGHRAVPGRDASRGDLHPRRSRRRRRHPASGRGVRRDRAFRRHRHRASVRGRAQPEYPRTLPRLRSRAPGARPRRLRLLQPRRRLSRAKRRSGQRLRCPRRRVLRAVEGVWDKHGIETVSLRIGSCTPKPIDARMLAPWFSYGDLARAVAASLRAERVDISVIWGVSNNRRMTWWRGDDRARIGWAPQDSADGWTAELEGRTSGNPVSERHQGGGYCALEYSRDAAPGGW
jgi:hypothetical protein